MARETVEAEEAPPGGGGTVGARMASAGYTTGFDYLRIGLAFAVVLWHSVAVSGDLALKAVALGPIVGPFQALILPMFFALSGFLISGSVERSKTLAGFITLRVVRLMPALAVEVLLSALILGPIVTDLPLGRYFADHRFFGYFWNIVGHIHFELPGVFTTNAYPNIVNISLWTVPFELECYAALVVLVAIGLFRRPRYFVALTAALIVVGSVLLIWHAGGIAQMRPGVNGRALVLAFLCGNAVYLLRHRLRLSGAYALLAFVACIAALSFTPTRTLSVVPAAYLTVWLGLLSPRRIVGGDYSYGVYLFAFPLQQLISTVPSLRHWLVVFALTIPASLLYAAFSWHCVEKPLLDRKKRIVDIVEAWVARLMLVLPRRSRMDPVSSVAGIARNSTPDG